MSGKLCSTFEALGYQVNNRNGKENLFLNALDLFVFFVYVILSIYNLSLNSPTEVGFAINLLFLVRLWLRNLIEQCRATKSKKNYGKFVLIYVIKITAEICIIMIIALSYVIFYKIAANTGYESIFMIFYVGIILFVTSLENIFAFLERIYDVVPRVIQYAE